ncbi:hypothetical protein CMK18_21590 [Candidatus Poribacteria bacterium]|nr:hypothetical protein [Candidatus Poribacteria bacterium]
MNSDLSWAFITGYYYPKFLRVIKHLEWDERYSFLTTLYNDKHPDEIWEERSDEPIKDMMEYVARKDYLHFFCMGFSVDETGHYTVHRMMREAMMTFRTLR